MTDECLGFSSRVAIYKTSRRVVKTLIDCPPDHWSRILKAWQVLSSAGVTPKLLEVKEQPERSRYTITMEYCQPSSDLPLDFLVDNVPDLVDRIHNLGYVHGDLHRSNIGFVRVSEERVTKTGRIVTETVPKLLVFDLDTAFPIDDPPEWVTQWMARGFGIRLSKASNEERQEAYEKFIATDYELWKRC